MSLIKFLFYRKKEQSVLASKKYGEKQTQSIFVKKSIKLDDEQLDVNNLDKCLLAGKYPKIETEEQEKEL